jgi:hypothetical protein
LGHQNKFQTLAAYAPVRDWLGAGGDAPFYMKFLAGAITGGVGSFVGNPFDVLKVKYSVHSDFGLVQVVVEIQNLKIHLLTFYVSLEKY